MAYDYNSPQINPGSPSEDRRFVEDDLMLLAEIDDKIRELLNTRAVRVEAIKKQNAKNIERLNISEDWFEGDLKGQPVRASEGFAENYVEGRRSNGVRVGD